MATSISYELRRRFYILPIALVGALVFAFLYLTVETRLVQFYTLFFVTLFMAFIYVVYEGRESTE